MAVIVPSVGCTVFSPLFPLALRLRTIALTDLSIFDVRAPQKASILGPEQGSSILEVRILDQGYRVRDPAHGIQDAWGSRIRGPILDSERPISGF